MSEFSENFAEIGAPALFGALGDSLIYSAPNEQPATVSCMLGAEVVAVEQTDNGILRRRRRYADVPTQTGIATGAMPAINLSGSVTIGIAVWSIESIEYLAGGVARLNLVRPDVAERSRQNLKVSK